MAILGLDYGEKRIGVALANGEGVLAVPLAVVKRTDMVSDLDSIAAFARDYRVERVVVGLPCSLDGSIGPQAQEVLAFVEVLARQVNLPVDTWDERFSSTSADNLLLNAGTKKARRRERRDAIAAAIILQGYLDHRKRSQE